MNQTTTRRYAGEMPRTANQTLDHLIAGHGWTPRAPDKAMIQAHRYAHGLDGRPDLADNDLGHQHQAVPDAGGAYWAAAPAGPKLRPMAWVILGWNGLMATWLIYAMVEASRVSADCYSDACQAGANVGTAVAIGLILFIAAVVDVILGVIWMVTKKD